MITVKLPIDVSSGLTMSIFTAGQQALHCTVMYSPFWYQKYIADCPAREDVFVQHGVVGWLQPGKVDSGWLAIRIDSIGRWEVLVI